MKYVVDIPESMVIKSALKGLTLGITMRVPSNNQDFVISTNIQLEPYTKPEIYSYTDNSTGWELYQDYQKAKERYETWKKQMNEIRIGNEVANLTDYKGVVVKICDDKTVNIMWDNGNVGNCKTNTFHKTGRHFPEIVEVLEKMRDESNES